MTRPAPTWAARAGHQAPIAISLLVCCAIAGVWFVAPSSRALLAGPLLVLAAWACASAVGRRSLPAVVWCALFTLLADRLFILTGVGGGSGMLRLAWVATFLLGLGVLIARRQSWGALADLAVESTPFVAYLTVGALLPIVGVIAGLPVRTLMTSVTPLAALMMALLGCIAARNRASDAVASGVHRVLGLMSWLAFAAGAFQFLYYRVGISVLGPLALWDQAQTLASGAILITGRSTGVFLNPNTYSLLGGTLLVYALAVRGRTTERVSLLVPAVGILMLSQSRGIIVALLVTGLVELMARSRRVRLQPRAIAVLIAAGAVAVGAFALLSQLSPAYVSGMIDRFTALLDVVTQGVQADRNLAYRVEYWKAGWELLLRNPLGTFGSPELFLNTPIDNDLVRTTMQGGFLYVALLLGSLLWMRRVRTPSPWLDTIRALAPYLAVASLTQTQSTTPVFAGLVALIIGLHVGWARQLHVERHAHAEQPEVP